MYEKRTGVKTVKQLIEEKELARIDKTYQRGLAWGTIDKERFIHSMISNFPGSSICIHRFAKDDKYYYVVDGQQRLNTLYSFAKTELDSLSQKDKISFLSNEILVYEIITDCEQRIREIFQSMQDGKQLNSQEKRNPIRGCIRDAVYNEIAKHRFFDVAQIKDARQGKEAKASYFLMLQMAGTFCGLRNPEVTKMYRTKYDTEIVGIAVDKINVTLDLMSTLFKNSLGKLQNSEIVTLFACISALNAKYIINDNTGELDKWLLGFSRRLRSRDNSLIHYIAASGGRGASATDAFAIRGKGLFMKDEIESTMSHTLERREVTSISAGKMW